MGAAKPVLLLTYCVLVFLILLGFFYVSLDPAGIILAAVLFVAISMMTDTNTFNLSVTGRVALFAVLVGAAYFIIGLWMTTHAPGGTYSPVTGTQTNAWWVDGSYTEFGRMLVWKWVGWGIATYICAEALRSCHRLFVAKRS